MKTFKVSCKQISQKNSYLFYQLFLSCQVLTKYLSTPKLIQISLPCDIVHWDLRSSWFAKIPTASAVNVDRKIIANCIQPNVLKLELRRSEIHSMCTSFNLIWFIKPTRYTQSWLHHVFCVTLLCWASVGCPCSKMKGRRMKTRNTKI